MSRPTVTIISAKGEASNDTIPVPNVFKVRPHAATPNRAESAEQAD